MCDTTFDYYTILFLQQNTNKAQTQLNHSIENLSTVKVFALVFSAKSNMVNASYWLE